MGRTKLVCTNQTKCVLSSWTHRKAAFPNIKGSGWAHVTSSGLGNMSGSYVPHLNPVLNKSSHTIFSSLSQSLSLSFSPSPPLSLFPSMELDIQNSNIRHLRHLWGKSCPKRLPDLPQTMTWVKINQQCALPLRAQRCFTKTISIHKYYHPPPTFLQQISRKKGWAGGLYSGKPGFMLFPFSILGFFL